MNIIETQNLTKKFGDFAAVNNVSLNVGQGEIYGFLGLNGAGKTTTIRVLLGMVYPQEGSVYLFGQKPLQGAKLWNNVGYMVETPFAYPNLTVEENLNVIFKLRGLQNKDLISQVISRLQLNPYRHKKATHLSLGNKQRLGLAKALMHSPKLLILDEPTNGLDPAGIVEVRKLLQDLVNQEKTTVFISSHLLTEVAKIATRIGIIHKGKLVKELNSMELDRLLMKRLCVDTLNNQQAAKILNENNFNVFFNHKGFLELREEEMLKHPEIVTRLLTNVGLPPKMMHVMEEDLEGYFLREIENNNV